MTTVAMFKLGTTNGVYTMSSLEMVDYINASRMSMGGVGDLTHKNFLDKVDKVLPLAQDSFESSATYVVNGATRTRLIYNFPKREACLMAMSYSYDLQAQIFDAWQEAEEALNKPVALLPNFDDPIAAAEAWIVEKKAVLQLSQTITEQAPKVAFHDAVTDDDTLYDFAEAAKILGIGRNKFIAWLRTERYIMSDKSPYQRYTQYLQSAFYRYQKPNGDLAPATTFVTSKGLPYFQKRLADNFLIGN